MVGQWQKTEECAAHQVTNPKTPHTWLGRLGCHRPHLQCVWQYCSQLGRASSWTPPPEHTKAHCRKTLVVPRHPPHAPIRCSRQMRATLHGRLRSLWVACGRRLLPCPATSCCISTYRVRKAPLQQGSQLHFSTAIASQVTKWRRAGEHIGLMRTARFALHYGNAFKHTV